MRKKGEEDRKSKSSGIQDQKQTPARKNKSFQFNSKTSADDALMSDQVINVWSKTWNLY